MGLSSEAMLDDAVQFGPLLNLGGKFRVLTVKIEHGINCGCLPPATQDRTIQFNAKICYYCELSNCFACS